MIFRWLTEFIVNLLPDFNIPPQAQQGFLSAGEWVNTVNYYIPFGTFLLCLAVYFGVWLGCAVLSSILQLL